MKLNYLVHEGCTVGFSAAAKDSELLEEIQLLLRNAGCQIPEIDGQWTANTAAALATFCIVHELPSTCGITPTLARELLEYREAISG